MTPAERKQYVRTILDQHAEAMRAFRASSGAFDRAIASMQDTLAAVQAANHAQGEAIDRIIAANHAALALFNED